jgi:hypothetical protein
MPNNVRCWSVDGFSPSTPILYHNVMVKSSYLVLGQTKGQQVET